MQVVLDIIKLVNVDKPYVLNMSSMSKYVVLDTLIINPLYNSQWTEALVSTIIWQG